MKKLMLFISMTFISTVVLYAQNTMKLRFPDVEIANENVYAETKGIKTFVITSQEEFDQFFKLTNDDSKINFENSLVLAAIIGNDKSDKFIKIDAASFISSKARSLYIRYDINDNEEEQFKKYCVAVVQKPNYKKAIFMKGKFYNMAISGE